MEQVDTPVSPETVKLQELLSLENDIEQLSEVLASLDSPDENQPPGYIPIGDYDDLISDDALISTFKPSGHSAGNSVGQSDSDTSLTKPLGTSLGRSDSDLSVSKAMDFHTIPRSDSGNFSEPSESFKNSHLDYGVSPPERSNMPEKKPETPPSRPDSDFEYWLPSTTCNNDFLILQPLLLVRRYFLRQ